MNKAIGYIVSIIGIITILLARVPEDAIPITFPTEVFTISTLIIGFIILAVGIVLLIKNRSPRKGKAKEVPIYQGKEVVGYRRMKK